MYVCVCDGVCSACGYMCAHVLVMNPLVRSHVRVFVVASTRGTCRVCSQDGTEAGVGHGRGTGADGIRDAEISIEEYVGQQVSNSLRFLLTFVCDRMEGCVSSGSVRPCAVATADRRGNGAV